LDRELAVPEGAAVGGEELTCAAHPERTDRARRRGATFRVRKNPRSACFAKGIWPCDRAYLSFKMET
jgi:hypothetical protein